MKKIVLTKLYHTNNSGKLYSCFEKNCIYYDCCGWGTPFGLVPPSDAVLTYNDHEKTIVTIENLQNHWNVERSNHVLCIRYKEEKKMEEKSFTFEEFVKKLDLNDLEHLKAMGVWISYFYNRPENITNDKISLERIYKGLDNVGTRASSCWVSWVEKNLGPREIKYRSVVVEEMNGTIYINIGGKSVITARPADNEGRQYLLKMIEEFNKSLLEKK